MSSITNANSVHRSRRAFTFTGIPKFFKEFQDVGLEIGRANIYDSRFGRDFPLPLLPKADGKKRYDGPFLFYIEEAEALAFVASKFRNSWRLTSDSRPLADTPADPYKQVNIEQDLQSVRLLVCDWLENIFQERAGSDHGARALFDNAKAFVASTEHGNDDAWRKDQKGLLAKQSNVMSRKTANYFSYMAILGVRSALEDMDTEADILEAAHKLTLAPDAAEGTKGRFDPAKFNDFTDPLVWSIQGSLSPVWDSVEVNRAAEALYAAYRTRSASELLHHTEYPFDPGFAADLAAPTGEAHHLRTAALPSLRPRQLPPILLPKPPAPPEPPAPPPDPKL